MKPAAPDSITLVRADDEQVRNVIWAGGERQTQVEFSKAPTVEPGDIPSPLVPFVQVAQFRAQEGSLNFIQAVIPATAAKV